MQPSSEHTHIQVPQGHEFESPSQFLVDEVEPRAMEMEQLWTATILRSRGVAFVVLLVLVPKRSCIFEG